ncbi:MAG: SDR family oxidoreductase [Terricaulis sp.]
MHILVLGGYGFIGLEAARALMTAGHDVAALGRHSAFGERVLTGARWIEADIARLDTPEKWAPLLTGVDVVVNASGALQDSARDNLTAVQDTAIRALVAACERTDVKRFVQISAPGADAASATGFLRTKAAADAALKASALTWVILRPGLVWGRTAAGGTALVRMLSAFPLVQPLVLAGARVQMADIDDVAAAIVAAVAGDIAAGADIDLVEPVPRTLADIVEQVRAWHGFAPAAARLEVARAIGGLIAYLADLAGWLGWRSPLRTTSLRALEQGVIGDASGWPTATFRESLKRRPATRQDRLFARMQLLLPLAVLTLSAFWIASGLIGLTRSEAAGAVLAGRTEHAASLVLIGALADIALGLALLWRPWARAACFGMIALTGAYLVAGTLLTPHLWADPLGPLVKTLPAALLALVCAVLLEER